MKIRQESQEFLVNAFGVALFVMAIILVTQFNSFYQAFLILSAVVFSTVGVFLALMIVQRPFGVVMGGIGVISLAGIVVNNNIVLIDTYNVLRRQGFSAIDAILRTGAQRLRPVMLTTVTTILGLLPMVLQVNLDFFNRTAVVGRAINAVVGSTRNGSSGWLSLCNHINPCYYAMYVGVKREK